MVSTVRSGIDQTVLDDKFLADQFEKQDFYNWLHDDLIRVALEDVADVGINVPSEFLPDGETTIEFADADTTRDEARALLRSTFPPDYLQETTRNALSEFIPYVRGDTDEFAVQLALNERVSGFFNGMEETYARIDLANVLVDELIAPAAIQSASDFTEGPLGITLTPLQAEEAARDIVPVAWIDDKVFTTLDALDLFMSGQSDTLTVNISFEDRVPVAAEVAKRILTKSNADQVIFDKLIEPQITEQIGQFTILSYKVTIEDDEIADAVSQIAPPDWVDGHIDAIIDNVASYMSRKSDSLNYTVDLTSQREAAVDVVTNLAIARATSEITALPACKSIPEAQNAVWAISAGRIPGCINPNIPIDNFLAELESKLTEQVQQTIGKQFPDSVTYDESLFVDALSGQGATNLEDIRDKITEGITIDENDILERLSDKQETAERFLEIIRTGRPYTQLDFERYRADRALSHDGDDMFANIDSVRGGLGVVFGFAGSALAILVILLVVLVIGILGGREWTSRLIWGASALAFASFIVWLLFAQILSGVGANFVEEGMLEEINARIVTEKSEGDPTGMLELARDEGIAKVRAIGDAVTGEFATHAMLWLVVGIIAIVIGIALEVTQRKKRIRYLDPEYSHQT